MISNLALAFARSTWGRYLMLGLALLAGLKGWGMVKKNEGRQAEQTRRAVENLKTVRRMIDAGSRVDTTRGGVTERLRKARF